jgi:hypothetical protein
VAGDGLPGTPAVLHAPGMNSQTGLPHRTQGDIHNEKQASASGAATWRANVVQREPHLVGVWGGSSIS